MRYVIPVEIATPNAMAVNRTILQPAQRSLFGGIPNCLKIVLLPTIAIMIVAMIQKVMANFE
jgi:hypothetical protein